MVTIFFTDLQAFKKQTSLCPHNPSVPMSTSSCDTFPSPPLARDLPPLPPINNAIVGSNMLALESANSSCGLNVHVDKAKLTVADPPKSPLRRLAADAETKQLDDDNRSIGWS